MAKEHKGKPEDLLEKFAAECKLAGAQKASDVLYEAHRTNDSKASNFNWK